MVRSNKRTLASSRSWNTIGPLSRVRHSFDYTVFIRGGEMFATGVDVDEPLPVFLLNVVRLSESPHPCNIVYYR